MNYFWGFLVFTLAAAGLGMMMEARSTKEASRKELQEMMMAEAYRPEPILNAVAKTVSVLTDGPATLNILGFRGDSMIVEINRRDTVAYKVR